ncbi:MAG: OmpA family protein [Flammeovirgaceae bacterium]
METRTCRSFLSYLLLLIFTFSTLSLQAKSANEYKVSGYVFGQKDKKSKSDVYVIAYQVERDTAGNIMNYHSGGEQNFFITKVDGRFSLMLSGNHEYMIEFVKDGFLMETFPFTKKNVVEGEHIKIEIPLKKGNSILLSERFIDEDTQSPLAGVEVALKDPKTNITKKVLTNSEGKYFISIPKEGKFILGGGKKAYFHSGFETLHIDIKNYKTYRRDIALQKITIGYKVKLGNLYYNINDTSITPTGKEVLNKLLLVLKNNPSISIELGCHTDSRGDDEYNLQLSKKRAASAANYLIGRGIEAKRIQVKGYGETQLVNECKNGVKCDAVKHEANRRVEYTILAIDDAG